VALVSPLGLILARKWLIRSVRNEGVSPAGANDGA